MFKRELWLCCARNIPTTSRTSHALLSHKLPLVPGHRSAHLLVTSTNTTPLRSFTCEQTARNISRSVKPSVQEVSFAAGLCPLKQPFSVINLERNSHKSSWPWILCIKRGVGDNHDSKPVTRGTITEGHSSLEAPRVHSSAPLWICCQQSAMLHIGFSLRQVELLS